MTTATTIPPSVTVCVTSCGRLDLLKRTFESFRRHNVGGTFIVSEDSTDPAVIAQVSAAYPDMKVLHGPQRLGIMGSIDRIYSAADTAYLFHLEDDWEFDGPVDWNAAIAMLESRADVANVCVRSFDEIKAKYRERSKPALLGPVQFQVMNRDSHPEFFGWSPNPGLIKRSLYERYKPFARVHPDRMSEIIKHDGGTVAFLTPGVARHIGQDRNVGDPSMPPRPASKPQKWLRAVKKKLYYAGLRKSPF